MRTTYFPTGSGDTTLAYIQNLCYLVFALLATLVWSLADYQRRDYRWLHSWLRVLVRYTLVFNRHLKLPSGQSEVSTGSARRHSIAE